jgi:hypothetical protein
VKPICIGVAPVKTGFGVLRSGSITVYKGMWEDGRFEGKGKLTWNGYCYEGDFKRGLFSGYGKLLWDGLSFMGKFENNKAEGEGTYTDEKSQIRGLWRENVLLRRY